MKRATIAATLERAKLKALQDGRRQITLELAVLLDEHAAKAMPQEIEKAFREITQRGVKFNMICLEENAIGAQILQFFKEPESKETQFATWPATLEAVTVEKEQSAVLARFSVAQPLQHAGWTWLEVNFGKLVWMRMEQAQLELPAGGPKAKAVGAE